jgi:hypothetical protein
MRQWQKDDLSVICEAGAHATRTLDKHFHLACIRAVEAMAA